MFVGFMWSSQHCISHSDHTRHRGIPLPLLLSAFWIMTRSHHTCVKTLHFSCSISRFNKTIQRWCFINAWMFTMHFFCVKSSSVPSFPCENWNVFKIQSGFCFKDEQEEKGGGGALWFLRNLLILMVNFWGKSEREGIGSRLEKRIWIYFEANFALKFCSIFFIKIYKN